MSSSSSKSRASTAAGAVEKPQLSTAISDAVLAFLTIYACSTLRVAAIASGKQGARGHLASQWQLVAMGALALTGVAAAVGTLRFAGVTAVRRTHEFLAQLAMFVSMPILGIVSILAYTGQGPLSPIPAGSMAALVVAFVLFRTAPFKRKLRKVQKDYVLLTSLFGIMCVFFRACFVLLGQSGSDSPASKAAAWNGILGAAAVMVAGAAGVEGTKQLGPIKVKNVDVFHYVMAFGNICLVHMFQAMWA